MHRMDTAAEGVNEPQYWRMGIADAFVGALAALLFWGLSYGDN